MSLSVLAFAGALRKDSLNRKLCTVAVERLRALGAEVDWLDLREVDMPLYDGDVEHDKGLPAGALAFRKRIDAASALLIVSPEYNSSIPGPLKNAIDWASRPPGQCFKGKLVTLMAASPGPYGGVRMIFDLRKVLSVLGAVVAPTQVNLIHADKAFDEQGKLVEPRGSKAVDAALAQLVELGGKLFA